jgi:uncharacterized protein
MATSRMGKQDGAETAPESNEVLELADCRNCLAETEGRVLLRLARHTIGQHLGLAGSVDEDGKEAVAALASPSLQEQRGVFVTLKLAGALRGCIGCLAGTATIVDAVRAKAIEAAFQDPRFPSLTVEEFSRVHIEVSV